MAIETLRTFLSVDDGHQCMGISQQYHSQMLHHVKEILKMSGFQPQGLL